MTDRRGRIAALLEGLIPDQKVLSTRLPGLRLFRLEHSFPRTPYSYTSEILILGQGKKRAFLGSEVYDYDPTRYLVLPVPLPMECEGFCEPGKPILGMTIAIDPIEVGELLLEMQDTKSNLPSLPRGIYDAPMSPALEDAAIRLLQALGDPEEAKILAPMTKRELVYRVLQGEKGEVLQSVALRNRRFFQIARVLQRIHESCSRDFDIERMAHELNMSNSTFHSAFKAVTGTSPLQYIKNVRLHKAQRLMVEAGLTAYSAAQKVGYESPSQFTREYKRLFGVTPARDATTLRERRDVEVSVPPP